MSSTAANLRTHDSHATRDLLTLAAPMIGMTVSRMMVGLIDARMVSALGTDAQAAISSTTILLFAISCVGMGMAQSIQTFVSQAEGRGEPHRAGAYAWQALYIGLLTGLVTLPIVVTAPLWMGMIARAGGHAPEVLAQEVAFLSIALFSVAPATACGGLDSFFNGIRRPRIGLVAMLASLVTITVGNYALIFGHWGFPRMGIAGSALATVISWLVRLGFLIVPLFWRDIDARYRTHSAAAPSLNSLRDILRVGWPISVQWLVDIGAWVVFLQFMVPPFGKVEMAAATIAIQYMHLSFMPALGIGMALTTQVGNAIGAGAPDEAVWRVRVARRVIVIYMAIVGVVFLVAGRPLAWLWVDDPDRVMAAAVVAASAAALAWCAVFQAFDALCITYSFALRGAGDTRGPAALFAVCCWGIFVLGGLLASRLAPQWGTHGAWAACALYIIVLGCLLTRRFNSGKWRRVRIFQAETLAFPVVALPVEDGLAPVEAASSER